MRLGICWETELPIDIFLENCWRLHWKKLELNQSSSSAMAQILFFSVHSSAFFREKVYWKFCLVNDQQKTSTYICSVSDNLRSGCRG